MFMLSPLPALFLLPARGCMVESFDPLLLSTFMIGCKLSKYVSLLTTLLSSWILVMINFLRFLAIVFPLKCKGIISFRRSVTAVIITITIFSILALPNILFSTLSTHYGIQECVYDKSVRENLLIYRTINSVLISFAPLILSSICNTCMIVSLRKAESCSSHNSTIVLLVALNLVFLVTTLPKCLFYILIHVNYYSLHDYKYHLARMVVKEIGYLNEALNFYMYVIFARKFREEVKTLYTEAKEFKCLKTLSK